MLWELIVHWEVQLYLKSAAELEALSGWHQVELGRHKLKALRGESKSNTSEQPLIWIKDKGVNYTCKKKEGKVKTAANQTRASDLQTYSQSFGS